MNTRIKIEMHLLDATYTSGTGYSYVVIEVLFIIQKFTLTQLIEKKYIKMLSLRKSNY